MCSYPGTWSMWTPGPNKSVFWPRGEFSSSLALSHKTFLLLESMIETHHFTILVWNYWLSWHLRVSFYAKILWFKINLLAPTCTTEVERTQAWIECTWIDWEASFLTGTMLDSEIDGRTSLPQVLANRIQLGKNLGRATVKCGNVWK